MPTGTSSSPVFPKIISVEFSGATAKDPVTIENTRTGERRTTDNLGKTLQLDSKKHIVFDLENLADGWIVGDVITVSIGGVKMGLKSITATAASAMPQRSTVTTIAVSTAVLSI